MKVRHQLRRAQSDGYTTMFPGKVGMGQSLGRGGGCTEQAPAKATAPALDATTPALKILPLLEWAESHHGLSG